MKLKNLIPVLALAAIFAVPNLATARKVHDFSCDYCHKQNMVLDDVAKIVCLDCHTQGHSGDTFPLKDTGPGYTNPIGQAIFVKGDASDAMGSSTAQGVTPGAQTSHNWGASDTNPAAGATPPIDSKFYGSSNLAGDMVSCARCHDPHADNTGSSYLTPGGWVTEPGNPKLLKLGPDTQDAMCVDCHTSWNTNNANAFLTHPMVTDYPTFQAANSTKFKPFVGTNIDGEMALDANGNMTCRTCHGIHFTDSDSSTTDGMGQILNAGDGRMLKGNGRMTGQPSTLCQSCHVYESHGAAQVGCIDCHSGHSYNNGTPNYFVLRDNVSLATYPAGAPTTPGTGLNYTTATAQWKSNGNGYCEGCHTLSASHNGKTAGNATDCGGCHTHQDNGAAGSFGGSGAACNTCHGYPPSQAPGAAAGYTGNEATAPHAIHAESTNYGFDCFDCHNGNTHNSGTFQDVGFANTANLTGSANYVAGSTTCQAVYCHGNGTPRDGAYKAANQSWAGGLNAITTCDACHGNSSATMDAAQRANSVSHKKHLDKGISCALCHNNTATSATALVAGADKVGGTHVNGIKDVAFDAASGFTKLNAVNASYNATDGTCSSTYCHSSGPNATAGATPDWDLASSGACGTCHDVTGASLPDAHNKHVADTDGPQLACTTCHTNNGSGADHVDGFISTVANLQTTVCDTCHAYDTGEVRPDWKNPASADCITCHTGTLANINTVAPDRTISLIFGHNLASGNYTLSGFAAANQTCEDCHDRAATHLTGTGNKRLKAGFSCDNCHGATGTATNNNINSHQTQICLDCHDPHGSQVGNGYMIRTSSPGNYSGNVILTSRTGANSFDESDGNNADDLCATCHSSANGTLHNNKENTGTHASGAKTGQDCMTCHQGHTSPTPFGVGAGTSCDGCHGFPPATGVHVKHSITTGNTIATSDRSDCAVCHTGADSYTYDPAADQPVLNHSNATNRPGIITAAVGYNTTDQTCANACHTSTVGNGGTWTNGATLACDACHYYSATPNSTNNVGADFALTGDHNIHFDAGKTCADCHSVPAQVDGHITATAGVDDAATITNMSLATQDEATILGTVGSDPDPGNATCDNAACHNPSGGTTYKAQWTVDTASCTLCHSNTDPATNNHSAHLAAQTTFGVNITCDTCHVSNLGNMSHLNGTVDMAGEVTAFASPNCTNNCHQDGRTGAAAVTATWGMTAQPNCTICHTQQPATGSHAKHLAASATCADCHDNTVENTSAATQHLDLNIDAFDTTPADLGYPADKTLNTAFTTCNAAACHSDGRNNLVTTPVWGTASACTECHDAVPATGSHTAHMGVSGVACADCHTGTTQGTTAGAGHRDDNIDTAAALGYTQNKAIASAFESCATASCHDNGLGVAVASPVWGTAVNDCSECHLTQPGTGSHTVHLAAGATCGNCHDGAVQGTTAPSQHGDNNVDVFDATPGDLGYPQNVAKGIGTWATCSTASCHNDGQSGNNADLGNVGANSVTTPQWGTTSNCNECHVAPPTSAKHDEHLGSYGATCGDCHAGAVYDALVPANSTGGANHRNGTIDVRAALNYDAAGAPGNGWGSCTNPAGLTGTCHGTANARPWDGSAGTGCTTCHGMSGTTGEPLVAGDMMSTNPLGQHNTHVNTEGYTCNTCHNGHGMPTLDDKITIAFTGLASGGSYNPPGQWTTGKWLYNQTSTTTTQDCSNIYCHSSGQPDGGGAGAPTYATPDWGNAASGACGTCHSASDPATGSHTKHIADGASCNTCHSGNTHVNQAVEVTAGTYTSSGAVGNGYGTCSTASCHDDGTGILVTTPTWGANPAACTQCHEAAPTTNSHPVHLALSGVNCGTCHDGAVQGSNPGVAHRDGTLDTLASLGYSDNTKGAPYGTCATASCHDDGLGNPAVTPAWGTDITDCSTCHATQPTTGSHTTHVVTEGAACNTCHDGAVEGTTASTNHLSGDVNIDATPLNGYANNPAALGNTSWTTCSSASCHVTGQAANDYALTPNWGVDAPNCSQCHEAAPTTGSHSKHIPINNDCVTCHTGAVKDVSYANAAHRDNNVDVAVGGYTANKALGSAKESCANISCHSDGLTGTSGSSPVWGTATPNCTACHEAAPTTGSHTAHLNDGATCNNCHNDAVESTTPPTGIHTDGDVDVYNTAAGDLGYPQNAAIGSGSWATCNAASCHDDGTGTKVTTPVWGSTPAACSACHEATPTSGSHGTHLGLSGVSCGTCHQGAVVNSNGGANHRDGNVDTISGLGYPQNKTKGSAYASCSTASCHNNGLGVSVASPVWGGTATCNSCHNTAPTTGSHSAHLNNGANCGNCHGDAVQGSAAATNVHTNDNVDVFDVSVGDLGYPQTAALGNTSWSTCNAASCHDNGTGTLVTTPTWGTSAACTECHTTVPATGAHTTHLNQSITSAINCTDCHAGAVWGTASPTTGHRDGNVDVTGGYGYPLDQAKGGAPYGSCATSYCHGNAMPKGTTSGTTNNPNWADSSTGCTFCHDMAPAAIGAHSGKTATDCVSCHDNVNASGTGFVDPTLHIDGTLQGGGDNCFDCHSNVGTGLSGAHAAHNTVAYNGLLSNGDYGNSANGWYNVTYTNGIPSFGCGFCHPSTVAGHMTKQTSLDPTDAGAAGTVKALNGSTAAYNTGTCDNVYCHSDGNGTFATTPNWSTGNISGNCSDCHGNSPTTNAHSVHTVGIHYTDLYDSDRNGVMQAAAATNAAHGDVATSTTITCVICHGDTVALTQNDKNDVCTTCHNGASIQGNLGISTTSVTHVNGQKDVAFNLSGFKSKAQLRADISMVNELSTNWTRNTGYKQAGGGSFDQAKAVSPNFTGGTCSAIICHNGNSANWTDPVAGNCQKCHTELPQ